MRQMESKRPVLGGFCSVTGKDNTGVKGREVRINLRNTYKGKEFDDWVIVDSKNREIESLTPMFPRQAVWMDVSVGLN